LPKPKHMKSVITSIILIFSLTLLHAQYNAATPNNGFEYWTHVSSNGGYDDPDSSWSCLNPTTAITMNYTCYKDSLNPHSGRYDAHLITESVFSITAPGALTTGRINTFTQTISGGLPYTLRPDSMIGWYKYSSVSGDNGDCEFYLFGATHADTIGQAFFSTPKSTVGTWTRFSLPIIYGSLATPDTALWIFSSSINQAGAQVGSQLYIDDLGLIINSSLGVNNIADAENITTGPNPTNGPFSIENNSNSKSLVLNLFDITGRKVNEEKVGAGVNSLNLSGMPQGIYIYSIQDNQNATIKTGKIVIQK
ncbi:MAG TPA: T9SS type A sorting domain-containing protein, partial [Bacteroidia bacterium]|nr:T9SS type A sorting domain-containing protein [Bacteroidia bacterium]